MNLLVIIPSLIILNHLGVAYVVWLMGAAPLWQCLIPFLLQYRLAELHYKLYPSNIGPLGRATTALFIQFYFAFMAAQIQHARGYNYTLTFVALAIPVPFFPLYFLGTRRPNFRAA